MTKQLIKIFAFVVILISFGIFVYWITITPGDQSFLGMIVGGLIGFVLVEIKNE